MENITLFYCEGSSDKVYQAAIEPSENKYIVTFAYGRRGTMLTTGTKTVTAVEYDAAKAIYNKLVKVKKDKGYTEGESGTSYQNTETPYNDSDQRCQLLNPITDEEIANYLGNFSHWMQQKMDGVRMLLYKKSGIVLGINRRGKWVTLPMDLIAECTRCETNFVMDGEMVGDTYHAFDIIYVGNEDLRDTRFGERYLRLLKVLNSFVHSSIELVEAAVTPKYKQELFNRLRLEEREGVVFKEINAPYTPGRPASGGTQLKYKFVETASFLVGKINTKRSVGLLVFDGDKLVSVGNVTIPANHDIPKPQQIVEVRYLYAFKGGSVFQPVYLGVRSDLTPEECTLDQLKYKPEPEQAAA